MSQFKSYFLALVLGVIPGAITMAATSQTTNYAGLLELFEEWREFESPPLLDGAPDYTVEAFATRRGDFAALQARLNAFDVTAWPIPQQVDWHLVRAEMNGYDFNERVLKPWARDPAFYASVWMARSDVPAHEGPTHHAVVEVWTYDFPLDTAAEKKLVAELDAIPPLMRQARRNLIGDARDLWTTGIRDVRAQSEALESLQEMLGDAPSSELLAAISSAIEAGDDLVAWLKSEADSKTGPSGIGKDNYTWYQQNVHLVPMTWEDEVRLLERELARAWSMLKLEEHRNRDLPPLVAASNPEEYDAKAEDAVERIMRFLNEKEDSHDSSVRVYDELDRVSDEGPFSRLR